MTEVRVHSPEQKKQPVRTCVGCRGAGSKHELVRVVLGEDRQVVVDLAASAFGRGAWVHARPECIARAAGRGLAKSFKSEVRTTAAELSAAIARAAERRVVGLLSAARRAQRLALGSDAAAQAIAGGRARLVVVSRDARAAADAGGVQRMIAAGRAAAWGTKQTLGAAVGRGETAVVAVLDAGIARALSEAIALAHVDDYGAGSDPDSRQSPLGSCGQQASPEEG